jgi:multicomponent Na+:H+ antiporter subunit C
MILWLGSMIAILIGAGVYLTLSSSLFKIVVGFTLIGHAINLSVFSLGGFPSTSISTPQISAIIDPNSITLAKEAVDPLPQALVLTAIVIGFGLQAFMAVVLFVIRKRFAVTQVGELLENERSK